MLHRTARAQGLRTAFLTVLVAAFALPGAAFAAQEERLGAVRLSSGPAAASDRVIVVWEPGVARAERAGVRDEAGAALVRTLGDPRFQLLRPDDSQSAGELLADLRADPAVQTVARNTISRVDATTNDPFFGQLWGLLNTGLGINGFVGAVPGADVDVQAAWDRTRGTPSTVVAIIDSGHRFDHPDLASVTWTNPADPPDGFDNDGNGIRDDSHGADFVGSDLDSPRVDGDPTDDDLIDGGHGSHVAGTAAAAGNNGTGITGVAQDVRVMPLRVCSYWPSRESGGWCDSAAQVEAINYAGRHGARVANMSLGSLGKNDAVEDALAANPGVLYVVSAGNGGSDGIGDNNDVTPQYPCAFPFANVVCVAATDQADQLAGFSNYGAASVDLGAPGTATLSTYIWPVDMLDTFAVDDFADRWTATGTDGGFARARESPLRSFGMTDSPGSSPLPNTVRESTSAALALPAGHPRCRVEHSRALTLRNGGSYGYDVLLNGRSLAGVVSTTSGSGSYYLDVESSSTPDLLGGGSLQLRFRYSSGPLPGSGDGVWLDNISVRCADPVGQTSGSYGFLNGTSMAAPHVTGAAALAFSLKPTATVAEVRSALLSTVDPLPALAGKTVTGGRLNVAAALNALVPPGGTPPGGDPPGGDPPVVAPPVVTPPVVTPPTTPPTTAASVRCRVPRLAGMSLRRARRALEGANCVLGRVTRPRARRGRRLPPLVVKSSRPGARSDRPAGTAVAVTLKVKPPRRARRRAVRRR